MVCKEINNPEYDQIIWLLFISSEVNISKIDRSIVYLLYLAKSTPLFHSDYYEIHWLKKIL